MRSPEATPPPLSPGSNYRYWAFISYSHADEQVPLWKRPFRRPWGTWLHRSLETYKIPRKLVGSLSPLGPVPTQLLPIFLDRSELPSSANLRDTVRDALSSSRTLIVICSPRSAKSQWVEEEIRTFKRMGRSDRILALIIDGEPNSLDKPHLAKDLECFPPALRYEWRDGKETVDRAEPIAADARRVGDGPGDALLKLIAGTLGVPFDMLKQRELQRRNRRLIRLLAATAAIVAIIAILAVAALIGWDRANNLATRNSALAETERGLRHDAERRLALATLDHGLLLAQQGDARAGLLWLARSLEICPEDATDVRRVGRDNLAAWSGWIAVEHARLPHRGRVSSLAISPDGSHLATASKSEAGYGDVLTLWDTAQANPVFLPDRVGDDIRSLTFSDGGKLLAANVVLTHNNGFNRHSEIHLYSSGDAPGPLRHLKLDSEASTISFSHDAKLLLTCTQELIQLWDVRKGTEAYAFRGTQAELSPDDMRLAVAQRDDSNAAWHLVLIDVSKRSPVAPPISHRYPIHAMRFSPNSKYLLVGAGQWATGATQEAGEAQLWDAATAQPVGETLVLTDDPKLVFFHPDSNRFAVSHGLFPTLTLRQIEPPRAIESAVRPGSPILAHAFSPTDDRILVAFGFPVRTGGNSGGAYPFGTGGAALWPLQRPERLLSIKHEIGAILYVAFSDDGRTAVTAGQNGFGFWDSKTAKLRGQAVSEGGPIAAIAIGPQRWLSYARDSVVRLLLSPASLPPTFERHPNGHVVAAKAQGITLLAPNDNLGAASEPNTALLWDANTRQPIGSPLRHKGHVLCGNLRADGLLAVTASNVGPYPGEKDLVIDGVVMVPAAQGTEIILWDTRTGGELGQPLLVKGAVYELKFSPTGKFFLARGNHGAYVWSLDGGGGATPVPVPDRSTVTFTPDERKFVLFRADESGEGVPKNSVQLFDVASAKLVSSPITYDARFQFAVAGNTDWSEVLIMDNDKVRLWSLSTGQPLGPEIDRKIIGEPVASSLVAHAPDCRTVLVYHKAAGKLIDPRTGIPLGSPLEHDETISAVAFSVDGTLLVTASGPEVMRYQYGGEEWQKRGQARLWDARTAKPLSEPLRLSAPVRTITFDPDGVSFVTELYDGTSRLWNVALAKPIGPPWQTDDDERKPSTWSRPVPTKEDIRHLRLWIEVATGTELDPSGTVHALDDAAWFERRSELLEAFAGNIPERL